MAVANPRQADSTVAGLGERYLAQARDYWERADQDEMRHARAWDLQTEAEIRTMELEELRQRAPADESEASGIALLRIGAEKRLALVNGELERRLAIWNRSTNDWYEAPRSFDRDFPQRLKDDLDLAEFLAHRFQVGLKRSGSSYTARCPFPWHEDSSPSFSVTGQLWHCFGCGKGGDVFTFLQELGSTFAEAIRMVAGYLGVSMPRAHQRTADTPAEAHPGTTRSLVDRASWKASRIGAA